MTIFYTGLTQEHWQKFNLFEQMGNIGSEVHRILQWREKDEDISRSSFYRALELLDFTIQDSRWRAGLKELTRAREVLCDAMEEGKEYGGTLEDLDNYFFQFALAARAHR